MFEDIFLERKSKRAEKEPLDFSYETRFSRRKTIGVYVFPDSRVEVRAPKRTAKREIHEFVYEQRSWIAKQLKRHEGKPRIIPLQYLDGEMHHYLGKAFPLRVQLGVSRVIFTGEEIVLYTKSIHDGEKNKKILIAWYRKIARIAFQSRLDACFERFQSLGIKKPEMSIRQMKTRWGSCSEKGNINLSLALIKVPLEYVDYVITHELCHLIEFNHSTRFYALQGEMMADWKRRKSGLNEFPIANF